MPQPVLADALAILPHVMMRLAGSVTLAQMRLAQEMLRLAGSAMATATTQAAAPLRFGAARLGRDHARGGPRGSA